MLQETFYLKLLNQRTRKSIMKLQYYRAPRESSRDLRNKYAAIVDLNVAKWFMNAPVLITCFLKPVLDFRPATVFCTFIKNDCGI